MVNTIQLKFANGETAITGINPDCTTKEVKEFYTDSNFLRLEENQVVEITFYKGFNVNDININQFIEGCMLLPIHIQYNTYHHVQIYYFYHLYYNHIFLLIPRYR